jgi:short-subunit dehydrogenase
MAAAAMEDSGLFKNRKIPSSAEVALFGYKAMMKGKMTVIHGIINYLVANSIRFAPRSWVLPMVRKIQVPVN